MLHEELGVTEGIHIIHSWSVADAAALAALSVAADDIGKVAYQVDTKQFYVLSNNTGPVWQHLSEVSGTFTPTLFGATTAGAHTYSAQLGTYLKRGTLVHMRGRITMTAKDAAMAGDVRIGGLPFTILAGTTFSAANIAYFSNITYPATAKSLTNLLSPNTAAMNLYWQTSASTPLAAAPADFAATTDILFSATYLSAT